MKRQCTAFQCFERAALLCLRDYFEIQRHVPTHKTQHTPTHPVTQNSLHVLDPPFKIHKLFLFSWSFIYLYRYLPLPLTSPSVLLSLASIHHDKPQPFQEHHPPSLASCVQSSTRHFLDPHGRSTIRRPPPRSCCRRGGNGLGHA